VIKKYEEKKPDKDFKVAK